MALGKSLVRSIIEYGSFIYFPNQKTYKQIIEKLQYAVIRASLGLRNSTPTNVLIAELKLPYLEERTKFLCKFFISKILTNENSMTRNTIERYTKIIGKKSAKERSNY